jgi:hypothetical protein
VTLERDITLGKRELIDKQGANFLQFLALVMSWFSNALAGARQLIAMDENDDLFDSNGSKATPRSQDEGWGADDDLFESESRKPPVRDDFPPPPVPIVSAIEESQPSMGSMPVSDAIGKVVDDMRGESTRTVAQPPLQETVSQSKAAPPTHDPASDAWDTIPLEDTVQQAATPELSGENVSPGSWGSQAGWHEWNGASAGQLPDIEHETVDLQQEHDVQQVVGESGSMHTAEVTETATVGSLPTETPGSEVQSRTENRAVEDVTPCLDATVSQ